MSTRKYFAIVTDVGQSKIAQAVAGGQKLNITTFLVGDSNGEYYIPTSDMTAIKNEVWRGTISEADVVQDAQKLLRITTVIPAEVSGFIVREIGLLDETGELVAIGNAPDLPKVRLEDGASTELKLTMRLAVKNTEALSFTIDPHTVIMTKDMLDTHNVDSNAHSELFEGKADKAHTHNYAGSSSAGGSAISAVKLENARTISLSNDVTGSITFDGSANKSITATLKNSGVAAGTYGALDLVTKNNGTVWVSNNVGLHSTSAISTWTAKQACKISFRWKVSSESAGCDYLNITAAGTQILANTGGSTEQTGTLTATLAANQTIVFTYRKDGSVNNGIDRAEISEIKYGAGTADPSTVIYENNVESYFTIENDIYGFYPAIPIPSVTVDVKGRVTKAQTVYVTPVIKSIISAITKSYIDSIMIGAGTGGNNTALGVYTLYSNTTGSYNTANGYHALSSNTTGGFNTANGFQALKNNTTGSSNTAIGVYALYSNTTGECNTANGFQALYLNITGKRNTALGYYALCRNTTGSNNTAIGYCALYYNTTNENTAVGYYALYSNTTGLQNTAIGNMVLYENTIGNHNTAIGSSVLVSNTTGSQNTAIGYDALRNNATGNNNTAIGYYALYYNTASNNIAIGYYALFSNTTGGYNTALGYQALKSNTTGYGNTSIGYNALLNNTTATYNTAIGLNALNSNTTGGSNTAIGDNALALNTTAKYNTAVGSGAMNNNTTGEGNTAVGQYTLTPNKTGNYNTAIGSKALSASGNTSNSYNTALGYNAGLNLSSNSGSNTAIGFDALAHEGQNCYGNVAVGYKALGNKYNISSGNVYNNTVSYNTAVGYNALGDLISYTNCTGLGYGSAVTGSNQVQLGNTSVTVYAQKALVVRSDARDKLDIEDSPLGLDFIMKLRPRKYRMNSREAYFEQGKERDFTATNDGSKAGKRPHYGLVAQEVKEVMNELNVDFAGYLDSKVDGGEDVLSLGYAEFIAPMIKAIQQQQQIIEQLQKEIELLKG